MSADEKRTYISIDENTFVRMFWFLEAQTFNVMGWMYRTPGQPWDIGYRFRWYEDRKAFNSKDRKTGYTLTPRTAEPTEAELLEVIAAMDVALSGIGKKECDIGRPAQLYRLECNCVGLEAHAMLMAQPWAQTVFAGQTSEKPIRGAT